MGALEDPLFDPWSPGYPEGDASGDVAPSEVVPATDPTQQPGRSAPVAFPIEAAAPSAFRPPSAAALPEPLARLRRLATPRLEALARRLRLARHRTSIQDLLEQPPHLIRFELSPSRSPLSAAGPSRPAVLEIGLGAEDHDSITAWYWLDEVTEAPFRTASVRAEKLTEAWVDRTALDFVSKALELV